MIGDLKEATRELAKNKKKAIDKLVQFAVTDMLLFWGTEEELIARQEKVWTPIVAWANQTLNTDFINTHGLDIPEKNQTSACRLKHFLEQLSDKEFAAFYAAAITMRSVLLAAALVKGRISAKEAFEAAFLEELWQNESWGVDEEAAARREEFRQELQKIEDFLKND